MKFLGGLQGLLEGEGVWTVLQDIFTKAVDLQTENNEDVSPSGTGVWLELTESCRQLGLSWLRLFYSRYPT